MKFDAVQRKLIDFCCGFEHHLPGLEWKPENEVRTHEQPPFVCQIHCPYGIFETMPAVYVLKRAVVAGFDSYFKHYHLALFLQGGQIIQFRLVKAVRPCSYGQAHHVRKTKRFSVKLLQLPERCVSIGIGLEVSQILCSSFISFPMELNSFRQLLRDRFVRGAVGRMESAVVAIGATAARERSVTVRAGEARIEDKLLEPASVGLPEISRERIVTLFHTRAKVIIVVRLSKDLIFYYFCKDNICFMKKIIPAILCCILAVCSCSQGVRDDGTPKGGTVKDSELPQADLEGKVWGVTSISVLDHKEITDLAGETGTQTIMGTPLQILNRHDDWLLVLTPESYLAWVKDLSVAEMTQEEFSAWQDAPKLIVTADNTLLREEPREDATIVRDAVWGCLVRFIAEEGDYFKVAIPDGTPAYLPSSDAMDFNSWLDNCDPSAESILSTAEQMLGLPYFWGGASVKGFDCSGFTKMVWLLNGLITMRNCSDQAKSGDEVALTDDFSSIEPADLVFFGRKATEDKPEKATHVGLSLGGARFIQSSAYVRISSLDPADKDYYPNSVNFIKVRRLLGNEDCDKGIVSIRKHPWYFKQ